MAVFSRRQQLLLLGVLAFSWCWCTAADPRLGDGIVRLPEEAAEQERGSYEEEEAAHHSAAAGETAKAEAAQSAKAEASEDRHLRVHEVPDERPGKEGRGVRVGTLVGHARVQLIHFGAPRHVEVPDWPERTHEASQEAEGQEEAEKPSQRARIDFGGPLPPVGTWNAVSFSGPGSERPMGPLLLACKTSSSGNTACEVLQDSTKKGESLSVYRAWGMWGENTEGKALVAILSTALLGATPQDADIPQLACCELTNNAAGCVACRGFPTAGYDPLHLEMLVGEGTPAQAPKDQQPDKKTWPPRRRPATNVHPIKQDELFSLLPSLQEQLGGASDPHDLSCAKEVDRTPNLPTLGDIFRSRVDLGALKAVIETSHIQQLVPCNLTFIAVPDERLRDFQGERPPACLAAALARPENQRELLKLVGRYTMLGKMEEVPVGPNVPVLYGDPANVAQWGDKKTWNNTELTGEKIVFDRGVIHLLSKNDNTDSEERELLRRIVYWCCLHDHLVQFPALTRFALIMVDNNRALPIIGNPPDAGTRPEWVAKGNSGWFPPPGSAEEVEELEEHPGLPWEREDPEAGGIPDNHESEKDKAAPEEEVIEEVIEEDSDESDEADELLAGGAEDEEAATEKEEVEAEQEPAEKEAAKKEAVAKEEDPKKKHRHRGEEENEGVEKESTEEEDPKEKKHRHRPEEQNEDVAEEESTEKEVAKKAAGEEKESTEEEGEKKKDQKAKKEAAEKDKAKKEKEETESAKKEAEEEKAPKREVTEKEKTEAVKKEKGEKEAAEEVAIEKAKEVPEEETENEAKAEAKTEKEEKEAARKEAAEKEKEKEAAKEAVAEKEYEKEVAKKEVAEKEKEKEAAKHDSAAKEQEKEAVKKEVVEKDEEKQDTKNVLAAKDHEKEAAKKEAVEKEREKEAAKKEISEKEHEKEAAKGEAAEKEKEKEAAKNDSAAKEHAAKEEVEEKEKKKTAKKEATEKEKERQAAKQAVAEKENEKEAAKKEVAEKEKEKEAKAAKKTAEEKEKDKEAAKKEAVKRDKEREAAEEMVSEKEREKEAAKKDKEETVKVSESEVKKEKPKDTAAEKETAEETVEKKEKDTTKKETTEGDSRKHDAEQKAAAINTALATLREESLRRDGAARVEVTR